MNKKLWNIFLLATVAICILASILIDKECNSSSILRYVALALLLIVAIINYGWGKLVKLICNMSHVKENCPYYFKSDCPYGSIQDCNYNTTNCRAYGKEKKRVNGWLWPTIIISIVIALFLEITKDNSCIDFTNEKIVGMILPILYSFIAACLVAVFIDVPGKMKEYQTFFVDLLSSSDYLKKMTESQLTKLRSDVTWFLHIKDYPNMPKTLVDMDERFCRMLKMPYFNEYSQTVDVSLYEKDSSFLKKKVTIEYIAFNPQKKDNPIAMDISFSNSLCFNKEVSVENAKELFNITKMTCLIDSNEREIDLLPWIKIGVSQEKRDGFSYNGRVAMLPKNGIKNSLESPMGIKDFKEDSNEAGTVDYELEEQCDNAKFYLSFCDKIKIKIEYEIVVPILDTCFTKRLRYPAKYFHLDYHLNKGLDNYVVVGQLIGTLMDQPDVSITVFDSKRRIKVDTHNWLLPKNGAVIVHCKK